MSSSSVPLLESRGLVAGQWKTAPNGTFDVYEPSSGEVLGQVANFGHDDFVQAIDAAYDGYKKFYDGTTAKERAEILLKWYAAMEENAEDLAVLLSLENGKTLAEARGEVKYAASFVHWFAGEAVRSYGDVIPSSSHNTTVLTFKEPIGVCGIITPWNFPAAMITRKIAPALAAGCAVVIKPPSETPFTALALAKLAVEAGVPAECVSVIPTKDRNASLELAKNPKVGKISFTGSTGVGKMLTELAAKTMKRVSMELGGNAPFIVFEDADIDQAADAAMACKFRCTGQTCVCANRLFVHEKVLEPFTAKLIERVEKLKLGKGVDSDTTQGPLVNASAVKKVQEHVDDAVSKGAKVRTGGKPPAHLKGFFFEPTVLTGVKEGMAVLAEETFGPLAPIVTFTDEAEVLAMANDTEFGLAGYFFSADLRRVMRVARKLECGMIGVNTGLISAAESPFGGVKESGVGREGSKYGLAEYQNIKTVTLGGL